MNAGDRILAGRDSAQALWIANHGPSILDRTLSDDDSNASRAVETNRGPRGAPR
jgi:hypothetical protein